MLLSKYNVEDVGKLLLGSSYSGYCIGPSGIYFLFADSILEGFVLEILACGISFLKILDSAAVVSHGGSLRDRSFLERLNHGARICDVAVEKEVKSGLLTLIIVFEDGSQMVFEENEAIDGGEPDLLFLTRVRSDVWKGKVPGAGRK